MSSDSTSVVSNSDFSFLPLWALNIFASLIAQLWETCQRQRPIHVFCVSLSNFVCQNIIAEICFRAAKNKSTSKCSFHVILHYQTFPPAKSYREMIAALCWDHSDKMLMRRASLRFTDVLFQSYSIRLLVKTWKLFNCSSSNWMKRKSIQLYGRWNK